MSLSPDSRIAVQVQTDNRGLIAEIRKIHLWPDDQDSSPQNRQLTKRIRNDLMGLRLAEAEGYLRELAVDLGLTGEAPVGLYRAL